MLSDDAVDDGACLARNSLFTLLNKIHSFHKLPSTNTVTTTTSKLWNIALSFKQRSAKGTAIFRNVFEQIRAAVVLPIHVVNTSFKYWLHSAI